MSLVEHIPFIGGRIHAMQQVYDTLVNFISGLGTPKDPRTSSHFEFKLLERNTVEEMYRGDWLARVIIDAPAEDATREWRQWQIDKDSNKKIEDLETMFAVQQKMMEALIRARLYGGGALVMGVDDGREPWEELDYSGVKKGGLKFLVVVNRYELNAGPRIYNVSSPYYTRPEYYTVATPMFGWNGEQGGAFPWNGVAETGILPPQAYGRAPPQPMAGGRGPEGTIGYGVYGPMQIHPSRVIEFAGNPLPDWRLAPLGGGWGDSVMQTVVDSLKDFAMIIGGLASMINDMKMDVVKIPGLSQILAKTDTQTKLLQRFGLMNQAKSTINTLMLDTEENWERISTSFGSTPELISISMKVACASGGIPESRAMGSAPNKGLADKGGSGGEIDNKNYYDKVSGDQKNKYQPKLRPLDIVLARSALGKWDDSFGYTWNPLYTANEAEAATIALNKAQATQIYVNLGLINEDAMRDAVVSQLQQDEIYPGLDDALDEHGAEPDEPQTPPTQMLPTPPPGMMNKGQFEPNPFHMLRAQSAQKAGLPMRVPPHPPRRPGIPAPNQQGQAQPPPPGRRQAKDYDPSEPRDPTGEWTSGGGAGEKSSTASGPLGVGGATGRYGLVEGDVAKFHALRSEWARVNDTLLTELDTPDSPKARQALDQMEALVHQMHGLHADPGGAAGIGLPGGPRDLTVVGAGPGGMAAAIMGGTESMDTLVVEGSDVAGGQAKWSSRIENLPGWPIGIAGEKLAQRMAVQADRVGAETRMGTRVTGMSYDPKSGLKHLTLSNGEEVDSRTVILAGGVEFRKLAIPGADGKGVFTGDGKALTDECAGGEAVVLGGSNGAAQAALGAAQRAKHVTLISRSPIANGMSAYQVDGLRNNPKVTVVEGDNITRINHDAKGNCTGVETQVGRTIPCKGVGLFVGSIPNTDWLGTGGVVRDTQGRVQTSEHYETGIPGVYAVGDMRIGGAGRIGVAMGEGQLALRESLNYLTKQRREAGLPASFDADLLDESIDQITSAVFALDKANPWFGQTVEAGRQDVGDFNPWHDPKSGRFTSHEGSAQGQAEAKAALKAQRSQRAKEAHARRTTQAKAMTRSVAAKAAHAKRRAREAEAFPVPSGASAHDVGMTAVSRAIASHKGHATKGEIAKAAKADVMSAVEAFAKTQHLKTPKTPKGMDPDKLQTAYRVGVATRRFFTDPQSRSIIAQAVTRNTFSFAQRAMAGLPEHALQIAHHALIDRIVDYTEEGVTDAILAGVVAGSTAVGGGLGAGASVVAAPLMHAEIEHQVEKIADKIGFTPEAIKDGLRGIGHALVAHYRKWRQEARHVGRKMFGKPPYLFGQMPLPDAEPSESDIIEQALMALGDVLGESDEANAD